MLTIYSSIKQDPNFLDFLEKCYASIGSMPMAEYWLSFMYMVEILIMNIRSIKLRNWEHFKDSLMTYDSLVANMQQDSLSQMAFKRLG